VFLFQIAPLSFSAHLTKYQYTNGHAHIHVRVKNTNFLFFIFSYFLLDNAEYMQKEKMYVCLTWD
jgi:hypothetical protein